MTVNNQYKKLNIAFLVIVVPSLGQLLIGGTWNAASNILTQTIVDGKDFKDIDLESVAWDDAIGLASSALSYNKED